MKRFLNILLIGIIYLGFSGKSCVDDSEFANWQERQVTATRDTIRSEFETDFLSEEARVAAEMTAIQKLADMADYMNIYTDASMDTLFREKAGEMIREIFVSENCSLSFGQVKKNKIQSVTLGEFMEARFGDDILRVKLVFDSIRVLEPLQKSGEEVYTGKLAAFQTAIIHLSIDSIISPAIPVTIEFISSKQVKIIGQDTLKVWEVKLGNLEVVK